MKKLIVIIAALVIAAPAFAGEDSTDRAYGYGPAWYETNCGITGFNWFARTKSEAKKCVDGRVIRGNGNFFIVEPAKSAAKK